MPSKLIAYDSFTYNFGKIPPAQPGMDIGTYFPEGERYRFKVERTERKEDPESGWTFIDFVATCTKARDPELVGGHINQSFTIPSDEELGAMSEEEADKKLFPLRKFIAISEAAGLPHIDTVATVQFSKLIGREFEATTVDYTPKDRKKTLTKADGTQEDKIYKGKLRSQIADSYPVGAAVANPTSNGHANPPQVAEPAYGGW